MLLLSIRLIERYLIISCACGAVKPRGTPISSFLYHHRRVITQIGENLSVVFSFSFFGFSPSGSSTVVVFLSFIAFVFYLMVVVSAAVPRIVPLSTWTVEALLTSTHGATDLNMTDKQRGHVGFDKGSARDMATHHESGRGFTIGSRRPCSATAVS